MNYKLQFEKIESLLDRIRTKSYNFTKTVEYPHMEDLSSVIKELHDIDNFLNDELLETRP